MLKATLLAFVALLAVQGLAMVLRAMLALASAPPGAMGAGLSAEA